MGKPHAQAMFRRDWNAWTVGYWQDSGRAGVADAFTTHPTEAEARAVAERANNTNNPRAKRPRAKRTPKESWSPLGPILFANTTTARMLRILLERSLASFAPDRAITQAAFMREYHLRCERAMPSRSSFTCNFGRFLVGGTVERPLAVIGQELIMTTSRSSPRSVGDRKSRHGSGVVPTKRNNLMWVGPSLSEILAGMTALQLRTAIASMESQLADPRLTDKPDETERWLGYLRDEVIAHDAAESGDAKHATEIRNQITQRGKDVYAQ